MARELLLAQSSDWAFQIYQGTTVEYSSRRFQSHIQRFDLLANMVDSLITHNSSLTTEELDLLTEIESRDNIFAEIDYRVYCS
jgi:1,4-alpha-glucan branching enzyme